MKNMTEKITGLALMREPFPAHQISKLPKETKKQREMREAEQRNGNWPNKCEICGGFHHAKAVHLDYVGHAALTDRLLDADPAYICEPMAIGQNGLPVIDDCGGLWVRLTVCGVTRMGYGSAERKPLDKTGGDRIKELIGDALRNAAMRFGAALDLWHKGDLHILEDDDGNAAKPAPKDVPPPALISDEQRLDLVTLTEGYGFNPINVCKHYGIKDYRDIPADEFENVKAFLGNKFDKQRIKEAQDLEKKEST
jgi:hypothetical protein